MATADEILATMAEEEAANEQAAEVCTIDRCTRAVTIPEALRIVGVETDKDVTRRDFKVLCSYRGTDLSTFRIRIHFRNANKETDFYPVTDAKQEGDYLTFSWVISRKAMKYKGKLQFIACMVCDGGTDEEREWNSALGEFTVLEGLEVGELTEDEEEQVGNVVAELLELISAEGETQVAAVQAAGTRQKDIIDAYESDAVAAVSAEGATQVAAVQAAGAQQKDDVLASISAISAEGATQVAAVQAAGVNREADILAKCDEVEARANDAVSSVSAEGVAQVAAVQAAGAKQEAIIAAKGAETLAAIPDEYATLHNNVAQNAADILDKAPVIIDTLTGPACTTDIAAAMPIAGLRLYGKTTQDGTPTPSAPVELVSVGAGGSVDVTVRGKNLLPNNAVTQTKNGVTFTVNNDGSITISGTATEGVSLYLAGSSSSYDLKLPAGNYIVSGCNGAEKTYFIKLRTEAISNLAATMPGADSFTHDGSDLRCYFYIYSGVTVNETIYPMVRLASVTDAAYEPYKDGGNVTASTPNGLPGIPVSSGGNYMDENGQQWVCDEVDFGRGVYVQRVGVRTLNGTGNWVASSVSGAWNLYVSDAALLTSTVNNAFCSHYKYHAVASANMNNLSFKLTTTSDGKAENITVKDTNYGSLDEWKAALAGNPITVAYILAAPIDTPIPADELAAYRAMTTYKPHATAYNDAGAGMAVDYRADTKLYIDKQITAIVGAMLNM